MAPQRPAAALVLAVLALSAAAARQTARFPASSPAAAAAASPPKRLAQSPVFVAHLLSPRAVCRWGTPCGRGCTDTGGHCCDAAAGVACEAGSTCTALASGEIGCCPAGQACSWVRECRNFADAACGDGGGGGGACCPKDAPVCDAVRNMCLTAAETKVALSASPSSQSADGAAPTAKNPQAAPQPPPYPLANFSQSSNTTVGGGLGNFTRFEGGAAALAAARVTTAVAIMTSPLVLGLLGLGAGFSLL